MSRQGSQPLTLFKGRKSRFDTLFKAHTRYNYITVPLKLNLKTFIQACSTVLTDHMLFVLRVRVDTAI